jgi:hypothetical protein
MPSARGDQAYVVELGRVLRTKSPSALRDFLVEQARRYGDARQIAEIESRDAADLEALMHRMVLARPDLADLHPTSRRWLASHLE